MAATLKGKTLSVTELAEAVQKEHPGKLMAYNCYKTTSPNFRTIVNQALLKDDRFKRVSRGMYTVKGSQPTTKKKTKTKKKTAKRKTSKS